MASSLTDESKKDLVALVNWLQTFPQFGGIQLCDTSTDIAASASILDSLGTFAVSRSIGKVAQDICGTDRKDENSMLHPGLFDGASNVDNTSTDHIWTSLLIWTSTRARPLLQDKEHAEQAAMAALASAPSDGAKEGTTMSPAHLKLFVISNLLDCAITTEPLLKRREYIERIMKMPKSIQKTLMAIIERRGPMNGNGSKSNSSGRRNGGSGSKSHRRHHRASGSHRSGSSDSSHHRSVSSSSSYSRCSTPTSASRRQQHRDRDAAEDRSCASSREATEVARRLNMTPSNTNTTSLRHNMRFDPSSSSQQRSIRFAEDNNLDRHNRTQLGNAAAPTSDQSPIYPSSPSRRIRFVDEAHDNAGCYSPRDQTQFVSGSTPVNSHSGTPGFLSPGILESPDQIQSLVRDLKGKNQQFHQILNAYKEREEVMQSKMQEIEANYRQQMIHLENEALQQQHEQREEYEARMAALQDKLERAEQDKIKGELAQKELQRANDELEVLEHHRKELAETSEKLRVYKDKVADLQDAKETLQKEQDAHSKAVDEIVSLENQVQQLLPFKRQLDDYKIRAIEAEVKLVECQDYLRRLEQQASDQSAAHDHLWKDVIMQKEQMKELQLRIQQETAAAVSAAGTSSVGDGMSELNPDIKEELIRLRNENFQLRAFAAAREQDAVEQLEQKLGDARQLGERHKQEHLAAKNALSETRSELAETQQRESDLIKEVSNFKQQCENQQSQIRALEDRISRGQELLDSTQRTLKDTEQQNATLRGQLDEWMTKAEHAEALSSERQSALQTALEELDETKTGLEKAERKIVELRSDVKNWEARANEMSAKEKNTAAELQEREQELSQTRSSLGESQHRESVLESKVQQLREEKAQLGQDLENERQSKQEISEEADRTLEATRQVLTAKNTKELEELQTNMNQLLDDERKAYRRLDEQAKREIADLESKWKRSYEELQERSTATLKHSREEAQERIELAMNDHRDEVETLKQEAEKERTNIVTKGKAMIEDAKAKAKKELLAVEEQRRSLEQKLSATMEKKQEIESFLRNKISDLNGTVDFQRTQMTKLSNEADKLQAQIKKLEREKYELQEDNDQYRRQLGGRYGADGQLHSQLEKLRKEYNNLLEENRSLKKKQYHSLSDNLDSCSRVSEDESLAGSSYSRGVGSEVRQMRQAFEDQLETVNDEKRELVMKYNAALTDVRKAESRAWEKEQDMARLQQEVTSLKLALERANLSQELMADEHSRGAVGGGLGAGVMTENQAPREISFSAARYEQAAGPIPHFSQKTTILPPSPPRELMGHNSSPADRRSSPGGNAYHTRSPSIERAMKEKNQTENALRNKLSSFAKKHGSPDRNGSHHHNETLPLVPSLSVLDTTDSKTMALSSSQNSSASTPFMMSGSSEPQRNVLSPTRKHENQANQFRNHAQTQPYSPQGAPAEPTSSVFSLAADSAAFVDNNTAKTVSSKMGYYHAAAATSIVPKSLMEHTRVVRSPDRRNHGQEVSECNQS